MTKSRIFRESFSQFVRSEINTERRVIIKAQRVPPAVWQQLKYIKGERNVIFRFRY